MVPVPRVNSPFYSYCISFKEVTQNNQASRLVPPFYIDIFFIYNNQICMCEMKSLSRARLFAMPWTVACTKLLRPWDFLGKSTGVGCRFLLQCSLIFILTFNFKGLQTTWNMPHIWHKFNGLSRSKSTFLSSKNLGPNLETDKTLCHSYLV